MEPVTIIENKNVGTYKMYKIITHHTKVNPDKENSKDAKKSVYRRYRDFQWLYNKLKILFYGHLVPNIPKKNILAKIDREGDTFIECRRRQLEKFLKKAVQVEALQYSVELYEFLNMDIEKFKEYRTDYKILINTKYLT